MDYAATKEAVDTKSWKVPSPLESKTHEKKEQFSGTKGTESYKITTSMTLNLYSLQDLLPLEDRAW